MMCYAMWAYDRALLGLDLDDRVLRTTTNCMIRTFVLTPPRHALHMILIDDTRSRHVTLFILLQILLLYNMYAQKKNKMAVSFGDSDSIVCTDGCMV